MEFIKEGYTRVSQVIEILQKYAHVPRNVLKKSQEIGTDVHQAIEMYYKGDMKVLDRVRFPYFESFLKWNDVFTPEPIIIEERFYDDELMVTGRIDLLAKVNGELMLIDFKTGSSINAEAWRLQGTFYRKMLPQKPNVFWFIQLNKDGEPPMIHEFLYKPHWDDAITSLVKVYRSFQN